MTLTPAQIAADAELCEKSSPGPWHHYDVMVDVTHQDLHFIARARTALPEYIALVQAQDKEIEALRDDLGDILDHLEEGQEASAGALVRRVLARLDARRKP